MSFNRDKLQQTFRAEYEKLNEQQRRAVDNIEGPVMVIAGPGTGKTQILASRIGKILLDTDALPQNILCLTYTEAGVVAMRRRLLHFIGPDAYKVTISTFHAFCNDVIQENLPLFEKTSLDPVSDLEKIQLFKELIDGFPNGHPLKRYRGDVYYEVRHLDQLFSTMKKEGWSPDYINGKIDEYLADLPNREEFVYKRKYKEFNAGDPKPEKIAEEKQKMERLRAAVGEFPRFQELMRKRSRYDFDDMINWVIKAFTENAGLLADYQERYQYILVDEYQDTSGTQNRLVELLISYWERPNVFVVGDDDQSIYRFQGANVENMLQFAGQYQQDLLTVVLTENYRSIQPILDLSKNLISRNEERLVKKMQGLSKELRTANQNHAGKTHPPRLQEYETQREEMIGIAAQVRQLTAQGVPPGRIGIIYKENKYGEELAAYFKLLGLPVYTRRHLNILELPLGRKLILLLRYLATEHDIPYSGDEMLFEILHFDWLGNRPADIARLTAEAAQKKWNDPDASLRALLVQKANTPAASLFDNSFPDSLRASAAIIEDLVGAVPNHTLQSLFEFIIRRAGVLPAIMQAPDKHWQLQVLTGLFDFLKEETRRRPLMKLAEWVEWIDLMEKEDIPLPLVQVSGSEKGVNLMTAHGSKGLEFAHVFFAGCNAGFWEKKKKPAASYRLPDTMFASVSRQTEEEELRRLFYVALTRAEEHLHISWSRFRNDAREMEPSMFIAEIREGRQLDVEKQVLSPELLSEFAALPFTGVETAPEIEALEEDFIGRLLEKFVMNVTALNHYLHCPLAFYYQNLVRIPAPKNEATEFGSAVHHALERLFRNMQESGRDQFPSKEEFVEDFRWYMRRHRESFTPAQYSRRMEYGENVLPAYYDEYIGRWNRIVALERNIRGVVVQGVPLKGKLDKLEFDGKSVNVVDYKTGDPENAIKKTKGPTDKDPLGGDYWRQAVFYKLLVDHYEQKDWNVVSTEFDFVEPDKKKKYRKEKLVISPADTEIVIGQIKDTWEKIQRREFYTGCGKEDCHWCNFVKTNNLAIALHEAADEEAEAGE